MASYIYAVLDSDIIVLVQCIFIISCDRSYECDIIIMMGLKICYGLQSGYFFKSFSNVKCNNSLLIEHEQVVRTD